MPKLLHQLPKPPRRRYLPENLLCSDAGELEAIYRELAERPLLTLASIHRWMDEVRELSEVISENGALAYIRKSVDTRDEAARKAYLHLIQTVQPRVAPWKDRLNRKLLEHCLRSKFPARWKRMLRLRQNAVDLFREKNVPIERQIEETALKYSQLMGGLDVTFEGSKQTLIKMGVYLESTDRSLRRRAWEAVVKRRYKERGKVESIYSRLIALRTRVARNVGFRNFRDFCHLKYERWDYDPKDCFAFHDAVEEVVVPAVREFRRRRAKEMQCRELKPWDLLVDPLGRPPLKPFESGEQLASLASKAFRHVDSKLGQQFADLIRHGALDLDNRPGKEPGGYQMTLDERKIPFIFMNAVGRDSDVRTLLHEGGHAFHMLAAKDDPILDYRQAPIEFCEVASMGMELLANRQMGVFYPRADERNRSTRNLLEGTLEVLPWVATIDAFQHWIYTHPEHSVSERRRQWMKLRARFSDGADWSEHREYEEVLWHRQLHLFGLPFYYIEYGIAQLGALMVWRQSLKNPAAALASYKRALKLGGSVGLKELFKAAGGKLEFSSKSMKPLVDAVKQRLEEPGS